MDGWWLLHDLLPAISVVSMVPAPNSYAAPTGALTILFLVFVFPALDAGLTLDHAAGVSFHFDPTIVFVPPW